MDISKRNTALDITRIAAFFSVICVHFFLNTDFYNTAMISKRMLMMTVMRTGFMICVPLFIILTGYLMSKKTLSVKYYKGIIKILGIYVLATVACLIYKNITYGEEIGVKKIILSILNYTGANYAWYIEMYIGLFMLIPFINLMYNGLATRKGKLILVVTFLALTTLPTLFNSRDKILPDFWVVLYPITYYFIGAYLKEYPVKLKKWLNLLLLFGAVLVFGVICYLHSDGGNFKWTKYNDWFGYMNVVTATLAFIFLSSRDTSRFPKWSKKALAYISDITLGAYLVSYIFDNFVYTKFLNLYVKDVLDRVYYFVPTVLVIGVLSLALSAVLSLVWKGISVGAVALTGAVIKKPKSEAVAEAEKIMNGEGEKANKGE